MLNFQRCPGPLVDALASTCLYFDCSEICDKKSVSPQQHDILPSALKCDTFEDEGEGERDRERG